MNINRHNIIKLFSVLLTIIAALTISLKLTEVFTSYILFLIGHSIMFYIMLRDKDWSLFFMNSVWVIIDVIGMIKWF